MKSLFELDSDFIGLLGQVANLDEMTEEDQAQWLADMALNDEQSAEKLDRICFVIREKQARAKFLNDEAEKFETMAKRETNQIDRLKQAMDGALKLRDQTKLDLPHYKLSYRSSQSVELAVEPSDLPEQFQRIKIEADKTAIKQAILDQQDVPFAKLVEKRSLQIR